MDHRRSLYAWKSGSAYNKQRGDKFRYSTSRHIQGAAENNKHALRTVPKTMGGKPVKIIIAIINIFLQPSSVLKSYQIHRNTMYYGLVNYALKS